VTDKTALRSTVRTARAARTDHQRERERSAIRAHVLTACAAMQLPGASRIAAYEPLPTEPGSTELLAELAREGYAVIVPVTLADRDLDWTLWTMAGDLAARRDGAGKAMPGGPPRLGVDAIATAALVLVPAFAVDPAGHRLGRGGGSYDRALARVAEGTPVAALLYSDELVPQVPVDDWDRPVTAIVTPDGWREL